MTLRRVRKRLEYFESQNDHSLGPTIASYKTVIADLEGVGFVAEAVTTKVLREAMEEILTAGSMHRSEIHAQLLAMGIFVPGRDPVATVGAHLSGNDRFQNVDDGVWRLLPAPAAGEPE